MPEARGEAVCAMISFISSLVDCKDAVPHGLPEDLSCADEFGPAFGVRGVMGEEFSGGYPWAGDRGLPLLSCHELGGDSIAGAGNGRNCSAAVVSAVVDLASAATEGETWSSTSSSMSNMRSAAELLPFSVGDITGLVRPILGSLDDLRRLFACIGELASSSKLCAWNEVDS